MANLRRHADGFDRKRLVRAGILPALALLAAGCGHDRTPIKAASDRFLYSYTRKPYRLVLFESPYGPVVRVAEAGEEDPPRAKLRVFLRRVAAGPRGKLDAFRVQHPASPQADLPPLHGKETRAFVAARAEPPSGDEAAPGAQARPRGWARLESETEIVMDAEDVDRGEGLVSVRFNNQQQPPPELDPMRQGFWAAAWGSPGRLAVLFDPNVDGTPEVVQYFRVDPEIPMGIELAEKRPGRQALPFVVGRAIAAPFKYLAGQ